MMSRKGASLSRATRIIRSVGAALVGVAIVAVAGCGWTNDEGATPNMILGSASKQYVNSRSFGALGQEELAAGQVNAARLPLERSKRFAALINRSDELTDGQKEFIYELRDLTLEWSGINLQALRLAESGNRAGARAKLKQAESMDAEFSDLISQADIEGLTDGSYSEQDFAFKPAEK